MIEIDEMAAIFPVEERFTNALKERKRFNKDDFDKSVLPVSYDFIRLRYRNQYLSDLQDCQVKMASKYHVIFLRVDNYNIQSYDL